MSQESFENGDGDEIVNVLALVKGEERYVFIYADRFRMEVLDVLGRFARNEDLSFSWYDAAVLSTKIRRAAEEVDARREMLTKRGLFQKK